MLFYLTLIFVCQLVGEMAVAAIGLPLPGPVLGMVLLFAGLGVRGGVPDDLGRIADGLLNHLSLLFVPAGVGVMLHLSLISADWLPVTFSLLISTVLTIAVTAGVMVLLSPRSTKGDL